MVLPESHLNSPAYCQNIAQRNLNHLDILQTITLSSKQVNQAYQT